MNKTRVIALQRFVNISQIIRARWVSEQKIWKKSREKKYAKVVSTFFATALQKFGAILVVVQHQQHPPTPWLCLLILSVRVIVVQFVFRWHCTKMRIECALPLSINRKCRKTYRLVKSPLPPLPSLEFFCPGARIFHRSSTWAVPLKFNSTTALFWISVQVMLYL